MGEQGLTRQRVFSELVRSPHGKLDEYLPTGRQAAVEDPDFFAHLVAWNAKRGQIRDGRVALPLIALDALVPNGDAELKSNALAHLVLLPPRDLLRGLRFAKEQKLNGRRQALPKLVRMYLQSLEQNPARWRRVAVQHRRTLHELYSLARVKPSSELPYSVLFNEDEEYRKMLPPGGVFGKIANLRLMGDLEAAAVLSEERLPFLVAAPGLGGEKLKNRDVLVALMSAMTPSEITGHMKMFERHGVRKDPALRGALEKALGRVESGDSSALKMEKAAEAVEDEALKEKIKATQEKKLDKSSLEGDWLVEADKSGSMRASIELAKHVAATLARMAKGTTHLVFFDTAPTGYNVTGKTLEQIQQMTRLVAAAGGTSIGCGIRWANERKLDVDGIVVVSDGGENTSPYFSETYRELCKRLDKNIPIYLYHVAGDPNALAKNLAEGKIEFQQFDVGVGTDYYSLPNLVATMRTNRYSLVDEIMEFPLLKLEQVIKLKEPAHA